MARSKESEICCDRSKWIVRVRVLYVERERERERTRVDR